MDKSPRFVSALVGALAAFGVLGAAWAFAQEAPTTTTTPPATTAPAPDNGATPPANRDGRNCDKNGDGIPDNQQQQSDTSAEQTSL